MALATSCLPPTHPSVLCVRVGPCFAVDPKERARPRESRGMDSLSSLAPFTPSRSSVDCKTREMAENGRLVGPEQWEVVFSSRRPSSPQAAMPGTSNQRV